MNKVCILPAIFLLAGTFCFADQPASVQVMVGSDDNLDACSALGMVSGLKSRQDSFLAVRAGPDKRFAMIDRLKAGQKVFICRTSEDGKWYGVVYSRNSAEDCGVTSPINPARPYNGKCKSGWVNAHWIKLLAG
jgi:hypothetical protein